MFLTKDVPVHLDDLGFRLFKDGSGDEHKLVDVHCRIEPFTRELAGEIHDDVKGTLFRRSSGEVNDRLSRVTFAIPIPPQAIVLRPDREMAPSFEADEAKVGKLVAKKDKGSPAWVWTFTLTLPDCGAADLAFLQDALYKQHYVTFDRAEPGLFDDDLQERQEAARKKARRGAETAQAPDEARPH